MTVVRTTQLQVADDFIDLGIGQPDFSLLPVDMLQKAADHRLAQADPAILQYGAESGDGYFRLALADYLATAYRLPVPADQLFVTNGVSQALDLICTLFTQPGDVIFVEEPSYFLALDIFADHHLQIVSLPIDEQGLIIDALKEKLTEQRPKFLYTIPTFQNPTGATMPQARREQLIALSQAHHFLIVADEVYQLLDLTAVPPAPMAQFIEAETVLSLGSFSKILAPGLRLGWIQAAPGLLKPFIDCGLVQSGGGLNPFTSGVARSVLELGWQDEHVGRLKNAYKARAAALGTAIQKRFRQVAYFSQPAGGFFIWLTFPEQIDMEQFLDVARKHKVGFQPGVKFSSQQGLHNSMRLCFAFYDVPALQEGIVRLKAAYMTNH